MRVTYSIGARLGSGIGLTAAKGLEGLERAGVLGNVLTLQDLGEKPPENDAEFDQRAAKVLEQLDFDVFCGWNNMCLEQLQVADMRNSGSVVIRASTHPRHQKQVLSDECRRLGLDLDMVPEHVARRCEYEFQMASKVLVPTRFAAETMLRHGVDPEKIFIAGHGVDLDAFRQVEQPPTFATCFAGGNWIRKGLVHLIEAWKQVPRGDLYVVGCNPPWAGGRTPKEMRIQFQGYVPDVKAELEKASCLVLPTLEEGQALVLLEAAALGRAIVATAESGAADLFVDRKSYLRVPSGDPKAIAGALNYLREDPEACKGLGREARRAVEKWPWSRYGKGVVQVCEEASGG